MLFLVFLLVVAVEVNLQLRRMLRNMPVEYLGQRQRAHPGADAPAD